MQKKISIIGGSGFIGTNLCTNLSERQVDFEIIDIKPSRRFPEKYKYGDVRNIDSLRDVITGDIIVNLAAVHRDDVKEKNEYYNTNVVGAQNITSVCVEKGIKKIVFTSSVAIYGFAKANTDEEGMINPFNVYGLSKFQAEKKFRAWQSIEGNSLMIIRPTAVFGEGNRGNVYNLFNQIASGRFLLIGDGQNKKSIAYVGNVVAFLEACIETSKSYGVYNYVDTPDLTMGELVSLVQQKLGRKSGSRLRIPYWLGLIVGYIADAFSAVTNKNLPISSIRITKFVSTTQFSSSKANLDGFVAPFSLSSGIERTLESEFLRPDPEREIFYTE